MTRRSLERVVLLVLLLVVLGIALSQRLSATRGQALASTRCTLDGPVRTMDVTRIPPEDTHPVRVHEDVHIAQCVQLGWLRVHLRNLTANGRLSLEAPGYCAGARARLRRGDDSALTRERMFDDAASMFSGIADSATVNAALRATCPEIALPLVR